AALRAIVDADELGAWPDPRQVPFAHLLLRPDPQELAARPPDEVLLEYWRMLFHARIALDVGRAFSGGRLRERDLRAPIERIGSTAFEEIRNVLRQEGHLLPPRDNAMVYTEFAAVFLELSYFAPALLPHYFPALEDHEAVEAMLAGEVDAPGLLAATHLPGAP